MLHSDQFRQCLETLDTDGIRRLWRHVSPHLPQPESDYDALVALHYARTVSQSIAFKLRAYSHAWLMERRYPSGLPDELRPRAERLYPRIVEGVGISVSFSAPFLKPLALQIQSAMSNAVMDAYADGKTEPGFVKMRMAEARKRIERQTIGIR